MTTLVPFQFGRPQRPRHRGEGMTPCQDRTSIRRPTNEHVTAMTSTTTGGSRLAYADQLAVWIKAYKHGLVGPINRTGENELLIDRTLAVAELGRVLPDIHLTEANLRTVVETFRHAGPGPYSSFEGNFKDRKRLARAR